LQGGKSLASDVIVVTTLAQSYVDRAATGVGMVAELAAKQKLMKYSNLPTNLIFQPIAVENLAAFISALGHIISSVSGEAGETSFLFQRLSVALQRFVFLHDAFSSQDSLDQQPLQLCFYCF